MTESCRLCGTPAREVGTQRLLGRHEVRYYACPGCELLFTEPPYWLEEAYGHAISQLDTGAVARNEICARLSMLVALALGIAPSARCLDFGGGHGVFVRMMRDRGLDFRWYDTHAENLYARGFEDEPSAPHALVTAFEVLEHFADVRTDLDRLFCGSPEVVLVGTVLHHGHEPGWWYYLLESGQHVSFYSRRTMAYIGEQFGYDVEAGPEYTLFLRRGHGLGWVRRKILRGLVTRPAVAAPLSSLLPLLRQLGPYRSRLLDDHVELLHRVRDGR